MPLSLDDCFFILGDICADSFRCMAAALVAAFSASLFGGRPGPLVDAALGDALLGRPTRPVPPVALVVTTAICGAWDLKPVRLEPISTVNRSITEPGNLVLAEVALWPPVPWPVPSEANAGPKRIPEEGNDVMLKIDVMEELSELVSELVTELMTELPPI